MTNPRLDAALAYAERGWPVFPLRPAAKTPLISEWPTKATTDGGQITAWWTATPDAGIGIATGPASGIWVLDIDVKNGIDGFESLSDLEHGHGQLPDTLTQLTPSGGEHRLFAWPSSHDVRNSQSAQIGAGLDVRGAGGYIVAAPTGIDGRAYEFDAGCNEIAAAPEWLLDLVAPSSPPAAPSVPRSSVTRSDRPGDRWAADLDWADILQPDGWTLVSTHGAERRWCRPGKDPREGASATTGHSAADTLKIFTSSLTDIGLMPDEHYTKIGYLAATTFNGNHGAAVAWLAANGYGDPAPDPDALGLTAIGTNSRSTVDDADDTAGVETPLGVSTVERFEPSRVVFDDEFWTATNEDEWLIEPIIPRARLTALVGGPKTGKSLLMLDLAASAATGRSLLGEQTGRKTRVLYADLEMTPADLRERLVDMGYGPDDDLSHLIYYALPALPPFDTSAGGSAIVELATANEVELVVIDTTSRVIDGDENDAGTFANMYRHAFAPLKARGVAVVRLDHTGHENTNRARGSSAKAADVDLIWALTPADNGIRLDRTHQRISWAPDSVHLRRLEDPLRHEVVEKGWPAGTAEVAKRLDELGVPLDASVATATKALRENGGGRRRDVVAAAQRYRRSDLVAVAPSFRRAA